MPEHRGASMTFQDLLHELAEAKRTQRDMD